MRARQSDGQTRKKKKKKEHISQINRASQTFNQTDRKGKKKGKRKDASH